MSFRKLMNCGLTGFLMLTSQTNPAQLRKLNPPDGAELRTKFVKAFGKDFELVKDEWKTRAVERGGGTFWLAFIKAKRAGDFYLQYRYREPVPFDSRQQEETLEREIHLSIGPQDCRRGPPESGMYHRFCLNDTIIFPVLVNNYTGYEFNLARAEYSDEKNEKPQSIVDLPALDESAIANPALPTLIYAGRGSHKLIHRIPGYTLSLYAEFVAEQPGRMNLLVTTDGIENGKVPDHQGVPVIVLPVGAPATLLAGREEVRAFRKREDGHEDLSYGSSDNYMSNVLILQPGDRISVGYFSIVRNSDYVEGSFGTTTSDPCEGLKPLIKVLPFAPDTRYEFTEWIVDYLP
jgi:hypothetical protein